MATPLTRADIDSIVIGTRIRRGWHKHRDEPQEARQISEKVEEVVELFGYGDDVNGRRYICGYTQISPHARMSFSCAEGETYIQLA